MPYHASLSGLCSAQRLSNAIEPIAPGLGLAGEYFDRYFARGGLSTLRLIRYPVRTAVDRVAELEPDVWVTRRGVRRYLINAPHVDSLRRNGCKAWKFGKQRECSAATR